MLLQYQPCAWISGFGVRVVKKTKDSCVCRMLSSSRGAQMGSRQSEGSVDTVTHCVVMQEIKEVCMFGSWGLK